MIPDIAPDRPPPAVPGRGGFFATRVLSLSWLTGDRVVVYGMLLCSLYVSILIVGVLFSEGGASRVDFVAFQAAGRLALDGKAAAAYDWDRMREMQAAILGVEPASLTGFLGWLNPPHFFFAVMPFAGLPYAWAWMAWIIACSVIFALAIRAVMPGAAPVVAAFCIPSVLITLGIGQNGLLVAALMALTLALLDGRPLAAGVALGLLTIKPQFGLIFPLLLALTGRWQVFLAAGAAGLAAMAASWAAFGTEAWLAFLPSVSGAAGRYLVTGTDVLPRIQSVQSFVLLTTGREGLAWALHAVFAAAILAVVLRLWLRQPEAPEESRAATAIACAFLVTPYVWTYDTPALAIAALFLARAGRRIGWLPLEKLLLIIACAVPGLVLFLGSHPLVAPSAWLLILTCAWRRDRAFRLSLAPTGLPCAGT